MRGNKGNFSSYPSSELLRNPPSPEGEGKKEAVSRCAIEAEVDDFTYVKGAVCHVVRLPLGGKLSAIAD